jgi:hypothetical protein
VQPGGWKRDEAIARFDTTSVNDPRARNEADNEAGDVVLAICVEAGHFRRLAAE